MSNQALLYIGVGLNAAVATMSPVATATLTWIAGRSFTMGAWSGIGLACCGAVLIGFGEVRGGIFKDQVGTTTIVTGLCLAGGAVLFRASKVVLQDMLMKPSAYDADPKKKQNPGSRYRPHAHLDVASTTLFFVGDNVWVFYGRPLRGVETA